MDSEIYQEQDAALVPRQARGNWALKINDRCYWFESKAAAEIGLLLHRRAAEAITVRGSRES